MRERSQGRRKPRGGDFRSVAEKILPRTLDVVTRITLYGKAAALWVVASACFLAKERFRDKPSGKPLFLKGLLRTGGSCTQRGGQSPLFFFFFFYFFQVFFTSFYLYIFFHLQPDKKKYYGSTAFEKSEKSALYFQQKQSSFSVCSTPILPPINKKQTATTSVDHCLHRKFFSKTAGIDFFVSV